MKFSHLILSILTISCGCTAALEGPTKNKKLASSVGETVADIDSKTPPSFRPEYIFEIIKNVVEGLPTQEVSAMVNALCSAYISIGKENTPDEYEPKLENIKLQLRTTCAEREYGLDNLDKLAKDPGFDATKKTIIFATGWKTTKYSAPNHELAKAYNCRGDTNFLVVDGGDYLDTMYIWSATNAEKIGKYLALFIQRLSAFIDLKDLHLMGHSLGAQIVGSAARHYRSLTGITLPYITGLDPAFPCFHLGENLTTLSASDAEFVDVIHTSSGTFGQPTPYGNVDFFVGGRFPIQNACQNPLCSHQMAWIYYTETVYPTNERDFLAKRCDSLFSLINGECNGEEYPMGYAVPHNLSGTLVLKANARRPYGKNATANYTNPHLTNCGRCPNVIVTP